MKQYRCVECTLLRCDWPGEACEECRQNMQSAPTVSVEIIAETQFAEAGDGWGNAP
jgi:hypothetical protein